MNVALLLLFFYIASQNNKKKQFFWGILITALEQFFFLTLHYSPFPRFTYLRLIACGKSFQMKALCKKAVRRGGAAFNIPAVTQEHNGVEIIKNSTAARF